MLESNPSRNSRLETHPKMSRGVELWVGASIVRIDFLMPFKTHQEKAAAKRHPFFAATGYPAALLLANLEAGAVRFR